MDVSYNIHEAVSRPSAYPLNGHYMLLLVRVESSEIHPVTAPESFASGCQCYHGSVSCAHVNFSLSFPSGRDEEEESSTFRSLRHLQEFA